jgi:hypothetical protein
MVCTAAMRARTILRLWLGRFSFVLSLFLIVLTLIRISVVGSFVFTTFSLMCQSDVRFFKVVNGTLITISSCDNLHGSGLPDFEESHSEIFISVIILCDL